ncbi:MAG: GTPase Era [Gemmatimonadaceae bacterium]|nr:GTPase Era [Gemmatimonadaceae bacterium]
MTRCAFVAVVGAPNAGKSTLFNRLIGQRFAIVSPRPQSSRQRVVGIHSTDDVQLIFTDTPGLLDPKYHLQRAMKREALEALEGADLVLFLVDGQRDDAPGPDTLANLGLSRRAPLIVAVNKLDELGEDRRRQLQTTFPEAAFISAARGDGVAELLLSIQAAAPEGPFHFDPEDASTQPLRFFVAEAVREAAFEQLEEELPYAVHCEIEEFREDRTPVYIRATLSVERESQKRILIGHGGSRIREIGRAARGKVEPLVGGAVYLDLWVKVVPNWRRNVAALARLGFTLPKE